MLNHKTSEIYGSCCAVHVGQNMMYHTFSCCYFRRRLPMKILFYSKTIFVTLSCVNVDIVPLSIGQIVMNLSVGVLVFMLFSQSLLRDIST